MTLFLQFAVEQIAKHRFQIAEKAQRSGFFSRFGSGGLGLTIVKKALDIMQIPFGIENKDDGVVFWMEP